jgi:hypothetical protein
MAAFAAGTKVRKKASPHPTEEGYDLTEGRRKRGPQCELLGRVLKNPTGVRWHGALRCVDCDSAYAILMNRKNHWLLQLSCFSAAVAASREGHRLPNFHPGL